MGFTTILLCECRCPSFAPTGAIPFGENRTNEGYARLCSFPWCSFWFTLDWLNRRSRLLPLCRRHLYLAILGQLSTLRIGILSHEKRRRITFIFRHWMGPTRTRRDFHSYSSWFRALIVSNGPEPRENGLKVLLCSALLCAALLLSLLSI